MIKPLPYTTKWKDQFNQLSNLLLSTSTDLFLEIAHIGSTSIPQAPAKDIVDIQCAILSFDKINQLKAILASLGFKLVDLAKQDHVPFCSADHLDPQWEKRLFSGIWNGQTFNIHIRLHNSLNWKFAIQFRDFMIANQVKSKICCKFPSLIRSLAFAS